jgi:tetratricopeptide (TPR) repeat protein
LTKLDLPDQKIQELLSLLSIFPNEPVFLYELALTYELFDENQKSISLYLRALKVNKYHQESLNQVAGQVFYLGSPELSIMLYKKLIGKDVLTFPLTQPNMLT